MNLTTPPVPRFAPDAADRARAQAVLQTSFEPETSFAPGAPAPLDHIPQAAPGSGEDFVGVSAPRPASSVRPARALSGGVWSEYRVDGMGRLLRALRNGDAETSEAAHV